MLTKNYAVFGLGRYGRSVALELLRSGAEVLTVDISQEVVNEAGAALPYCRCADITDPEVIRQLDIAAMDVVIIAMANNLEASVMAVTLCKEAGVPTVIAKCGSELHEKILLRVGADRVVFPERESGTRLAKNLLTAGFADMIELSPEVAMVEIGVRPEWSGKTLIELELRRRYGINIVAILTPRQSLIDIDPHMKINTDMRLVIVARTDKLQALNE